MRTDSSLRKRTNQKRLQQYELLAHSANQPCLMPLHTSQPARSRSRPRGVEETRSTPLRPWRSLGLSARRDQLDQVVHSHSLLVRPVARLLVASGTCKAVNSIASYCSQYIASLTPNRSSPQEIQRRQHQHCAKALPKTARDIARDRRRLGFNPLATVSRIAIPSSQQKWQHPTPRPHPSP